MTAAPAGGGTALRALARVGEKHGLAVTGDRLVRDHGTPGAEPTLGELVSVGRRIGLKARATRLDFARLHGLDRAFPAILKLRDGTFLVAEKAGRDGDVPVVVLSHPADPAAEAVAVDQVRLEQVWAGEAVLLRRALGGPDTARRFDFGFMAAEMLRERALFRDIGLAATVMSVLTLVPPLVYMVVVDRVLVHQRLSTLTVLTIGIAAILVFDTLLGWLRRTIVAHAAARIDTRVNLHLFDRLMGLPIEFFEKNPTGVIAHKLGEARRVRLFLTGQLFGTVLDGMTLVVLVPAMFVLNATLAFFVLGVAGAMALVVLAFMGPMSRAYGRVVAAEQAKTSLLVETIQGMRTVKSLALEGRRRRDWDERVAAAVTAATDLQKLANRPQTLLAPLEKLIYAGTLLLGAYLAIAANDVVYAGTLVAFTMIATRATQPIIQMAGLMQQVHEARGALDQVAAVVDEVPEPRREAGVRPDIRGAVRFEDVRFTYPGAGRPALDGVTFEIGAGMVVGVMGRSGSGKTTITRLLQGLHQGYTGTIKVDGIDLREIDLDHLRSRTGVVLQDSFLFSGTIRDNVLIGRPDAGPAAMIEAARLAGAEEFVERLPRGFETMIEEQASNLSGGQRQRLAIARALVTDPPLLVFDEATSALDPDSEAIIQTNLKKIAAGRTVVMISHRLASLVECDRILVMDRGRVVDAGRHTELILRSEIYRHLWFQQNRHLGPAAAGPVSATPSSPSDERAEPRAVARG